MMKILISFVVASVLAYYFGLYSTKQYLSLFILFVGVYAIFHFALLYYSKRKLKYGLWITVPLGIAMWFGAKLQDGSVDAEPFSIADIPVLVCLVLILTAITIIILSFISKNLFISKKNVKGRVWINTLIIFACYIPLFLAFFPGLISNDSAVQLNQAVGNSMYSNWHPVVHTLFIALPVNLGIAISGDLTMGIALSTLLQMAILSVIFGYVSNWSIKISGKKWIGYVLVGFFALCPVIACYSVSMWKDVLFSAFFLLLVTKVYDLIISKDRESKVQVKDLVGIILVSILMCFFRNGAILIIVALGIGLVIYYKNTRLKTSLVFICMVLLVLIIQKPIYALLGITNSPFMESMSIPAQQIGYVARNGSLSDEEKNELSKFADVEKLSNNYSPMNADPAKTSFYYDVVEEDKMGLVSLWFRMLFSHFGEYIYSYILQTYSYWYPQGDSWALDLEHNHESIWLQEEYNNLSLVGDVGYKVIKGVESKLMYSVWFGWMNNVGFMFWSMIFMVVIFFYQKRYEMMIIMCPILTYMVSLLIASPVSMMFRYVYSLLLILPILIIVSFIKRKGIKR